MPLNRRGFFSAVSSAFAGAPVAKAVALPPRMAAAAPPNEFTVPGWKIHWTGWKTSYDQAALCGQWLANPVQRDGSLVLGMPSVYSSIPGNCGAYWPGDAFDVCMRFAQPPTDETSSDELRELGRRNALALLLDVLRNKQHWTRQLPSRCAPANVRDAWAHLKPASQFLLDPWSYLEERWPRLADHGIPGTHDTLLAERKHLLGF